MEEIDYEKLLAEARKISYEALGNFFRNLGLNPDAFMHLYQIPVVIDMDNDICEDAGAVFDPNGSEEGEAIVYVNRDTIDFWFDDKNNSYHNIVIGVAEAITHELIHASRSVMLKNEINALNYENIAFDMIESHMQEKREAESYDELLVDSLIFNENAVRKYTVVKCSSYEDGTFDVVAFNNKTKCYDIFKHQRFMTKFNGDTVKFLQNLSMEMSLLTRNVPQKSIKSQIFLNRKRRFSVLGMDIYHKNEDSYIFDKVKNEEDAFDLSDKLDESIDNQKGLEEGLTEVLASMIIMGRNDKEFDIPKYSKKIIDNCEFLDEVCACEIIQKYGIDFIRNFILYPYEPEFRNVCYEIFGSEYEKLNSLMNELYISIKQEDDKSVIYDRHNVNLYNEIINIIDKNEMKR